MWCAIVFTEEPRAMYLDLNEVPENALASTGIGVFSGDYEDEDTRGALYTIEPSEFATLSPGDGREHRWEQALLVARLMNMDADASGE